MTTPDATEGPTLQTPIRTWTEVRAVTPWSQHVWLVYGGKLRWEWTSVPDFARHFGSDEGARRALVEVRRGGMKVVGARLVHVSRYRRGRRQAAGWKGAGRG